MKCLATLPDKRARNITTLNDNSFKDNSLRGCTVCRCLRASLTSQTSWYFGIAGLIVNVPLRKRETSGWFPNDKFP